MGFPQSIKERFRFYVGLYPHCCTVTYFGVAVLNLLAIARKCSSTPSERLEYIFCSPNATPLYECRIFSCGSSEHTNSCKFRQKLDYVNCMLFSSTTETQGCGSSPTASKTVKWISHQAPFFF